MMIDTEREKLRQEFMLEMLEQGWTPPPEDPHPLPKKYQLHETGWGIDILGSVVRCSDANSFEEVNFIRAGLSRKTKEAAEIAAKRMHRMMPLSALAAELGGEREFVTSKKNWFIARNGANWIEGYSTSYYNPEKVYMTKECAEKICRMLNTGEFEI